jgi:protoporphyrinogen oxidase
VSAEARVAIVGAGPAGLTAAWELARLGVPATVYERDADVGGISRTAEHEGFRFDLGGHRFFTKSAEVRAVWFELLGDDLLERPRLSRIYYRGHFFDYPLRPLNALAGLGPFEAARCVASYLAAKLRPEPEERSFEQWVVNRFGRRLFEIFFETYTEKVWGMKCSEISADWAAQRIKNLNLARAVRAALFGGAGGEIVTTLINRFHYPRHGPGMMWRRCAERLAAVGSPTLLGREVVRIEHRDGRVTAIELRGPGGEAERREVDHLIASLPLGVAVERLDPPAPPEVRAAARGLRHRDFLTVVLVVDEPELFPDNWIYVHAPEVRVGRIQNFKNWSPEMVPDPARTALGLEYFVDRDEELWSRPDAELVALGTVEIDRLGLARAASVVGGTVVRVPCAYPVYDEGYRERIRVVREHLASFANLEMVGRNGQHRYNNQDHSMLTGIHAARNVALGERNDVWSVNVGDEYHEEARESGDRQVPALRPEATLDELVTAAFRRFDPWAMAGAVGATTALAILLPTLVQIARGDGPAAPMLSLLGVYLVGYEVSWRGLVFGLLEAGALGFGLGAAIAGASNALVGLAERALRRELEAEERIDPLHGAVP